MEKLRGVSLGPGTLLVDERSLYDEFAPFGFTRNGWTRQLRALGVEPWVMPDGTKLINFRHFQLAVAVATRVGAKGPFLSPGCELMKKPDKRPKDFRRDITAEEWAEHWKAALAGLLASKQLDGKFTRAEVRTAMEDLGKRIGFALAKQSLTLTQEQRKRMMDRFADVLDPKEVHLHERQ